MIMKFLPLGAFCLVAKEFAETGLCSLKSLGFYLGIVLGGFAIHFFITIPLLLKFIGKVSPIAHVKAMGRALITAFSTGSSSATLPVTIDCLEQNAKVSNKIASLVAPLGTSINLSASAMFVVITSSFVAIAYGITLSLPLQLTIFLLSLLTTLGVAGIPSGCLITTMLVLNAIGVPPEGIAIIIAADRVIDMFRTLVNVFSIGSSAVIVARLQGETQVLSK